MEGDETVLCTGSTLTAKLRSRADKLPGSFLVSGERIKGFGITSRLFPLL